MTGQEPPALTPIVYLRGARRPQEVWDEVEHSLWARGYATLHDRTTAWHATRGGMPVVLCDFSADLYREKPAEGTDYHYYVQVGRVRARYGSNDEFEFVFTRGGETDAAHRFGKLHVPALLDLVDQAFCR
jgi:hypothetical protein